MTTLVSALAPNGAEMPLQCDAAGALKTTGGGGGGGGSSVDRELVVSTFRCKTAFSGASVGDTITATQVIDVSGVTPTTVSVIWRNQNTAADLASTPSAANLELVGSTALTDAQLRAAPIKVSGIRPNGGSGLAAGESHITIGGSDGTNLRPLLVDNAGRQIVSGPVTDAQMAARNYALDGTDATGVTPPAGAVGLRGWLSGIFAKLPSIGPAIIGASAPVSFARKTSVTGFPSVATVTNNNLLDASGSGAWTDVRDFNSALLMLVSGATTGSYTIQSAFDSAGTVGVATLQAQETTVATGAAMINAAITPTATTRQFRVNLAGVNYLRVNLSVAPSAGSVASYAILSQQSPVPENVNVQQATAASLNATATVVQLPTAAALADGLVNPIGSQIGADLMLFNGATWDRHRNNINTVTGDTGAKTASFVGATQINFDARGAFITILMGVVTGTTPTYTPQLQWSPDGGTTWLTFGPAMAAITATGQYTFAVYPSNFSQAPGATPTNLALGSAQFVPINAPLPRSWRINTTIGGTTPSFTLTSVQVNYIN